MNPYDARVDELAAELLTPDVDGGRLDSRREELIHELANTCAVNLILQIGGPGEVCASRDPAEPVRRSDNG